jgi:uncharacterized protein
VEIAITGSSGLIGRALVARLHQEGHRVARVVRPQSAPAGDVIRWDPERGTIDAGAFEGLDAVVHLAGAGIGDRRWTDAQKRLVLESRTRPTALLAETLAGLTRPPGVLVSGSAIGWYGNRADEVLTEQSAPPSPSDFVADVARQWEASTRAAEDAGIRTVHLRTGIVLSPAGGVLKRMIPPFKLGLGGRSGSGRQYMSWVAIDDELGAILHAIKTPTIAGPMNATAPTPVTNLEFTTALGRVLGRPTKLPTPMPALRLVYGRELVQKLLLEGQRVMPARLEGTGYRFERPDLAFALRAMLGRPVNA